ncbi:MAG TPA: hypothetical protein PLQ43_11500, partial [Deltaproteobacteria bacterium]|nr:hypothetical protein [Deltaproteobacteria bacterium]
PTALARERWAFGVRAWRGRRREGRGRGENERKEAASGLRWVMPMAHTMEEAGRGEREGGVSPGRDAARLPWLYFRML